MGALRESVKRPDGERKDALPPSFAATGCSLRPSSRPGDPARYHDDRTLLFEDASGRELYKIQSQLVTIREVMKVERGDETVATVKKKLISPLRERYDVAMAAGDWKVQGNIVDHEYEIEGSAGPIAKVGKKWFRVRDTYGVEIASGQDDALVLAVSVVVDQMAHPTR